MDRQRTYPSFRLLVNNALFLVHVSYIHLACMSSLFPFHPSSLILIVYASYKQIAQDTTMPF